MVHGKARTVYVRKGQHFEETEVARAEQRDTAGVWQPARLLEVLDDAMEIG